MKTRLRIIVGVIGLCWIQAVLVLGMPLTDEGQAYVNKQLKQAIQAPIGQAVLDPQKSISGKSTRLKAALKLGADPNYFPIEAIGKKANDTNFDLVYDDDLWARRLMVSQNDEKVVGIISPELIDIVSNLLRAGAKPQLNPKSDIQQILCRTKAFAGKAYYRIKWLQIGGHYNEFQGEFSAAHDLKHRLFGEPDAVVKDMGNSAIAYKTGETFIYQPDNIVKIDALLNDLLRAQLVFEVAEAGGLKGIFRGNSKNIDAYLEQAKKYGDEFARECLNDPYPYPDETLYPNSPYGKNVKGFTPVELAAKNGHSNCLEVMLEATGKDGKPLVKVGTARNALNQESTDKCRKLLFNFIKNQGGDTFYFQPTPTSVPGQN